MFNSAKCVGFPRQLKRLDGKLGLPPMPCVDVCLHADGNPESLALKQLRRTVMGHALVEFAGKGHHSLGRLEALSIQKRGAVHARLARAIRAGMGQAQKK